jgi:hypothetical protein
MAARGDKLWGIAKLRVGSLLNRDGGRDPCAGLCVGADGGGRRRTERDDAASLFRRRGETEAGEVFECEARDAKELDVFEGLNPDSIDLRSVHHMASMAGALMQKNSTDGFEHTNLWLKARQRTDNKGGRREQDDQQHERGP